MASPKVIAVVVNWNKRDMLVQMLDSLAASGPREFDVVVVDNASTDDSVPVLRERYPWVHLIENKENLGGTGGFNCGMRYALGHPAGYEFIWLLDNDVIVHPRAFKGLLEAMQADRHIGIVGSTILYLHDADQVQECGVRLSWRTGNIMRNYEGPLAQLKRPATFDADFVSACSLMARTEAVRQVGIWDQKYFVLWDDIEWGVRFRRAGWRVISTSESRVQHESYDNRRGRGGAAGTYQCYRNGFYFFWRWAPPLYRFPLFFHQFRMALSFEANYREQERLQEARGVRRAIDDFFAGRMGKPPDELRAPDAQVKEASAPLPKPRRLGVLARDNPGFARDLYSKLHEQYPDAEIDTLVLTDSPEMLEEEFPCRRIMPVATFPQRVSRTIELPIRYDTLAAPSFLQPFFFEKCVRHSMRFREDFTYTLHRRNWIEIVRLGTGRVRVVLEAALLAIRALMKRREPVNYHDFKQ